MPQHDELDLARLLLGEAPPALDRPAALDLIEKIKDWAESEIERVAQAAKPEPNEVAADQSENSQDAAAGR